MSANSFENRFTTDAGSEFFNLARFNALLRTNIVLGGPLTGAALQLIPNSGLDDGDTIGFRWNFAEPVDSFGFFAAEFDIRNVRFFPRVGDESLLDGNGDPVRFRFEDAFEDTTNPLDNAFYGVSGLSQAVTSIRVFGEVAGGSGGGQGLFTNGFVTGSTVAPPQPIPFPAALLRLASGLAGLGLLARRRRG